MQNSEFFGHCWRLYTNSNCNKENDIRISDDYYDCFAKTVIRYKKEHLDTQVYCFMHWNYDLEKYVMPMHVKLSRHLIDNGVEAVVGSHSHRPQGAELYKGKTIAYGLGNFYLPSGQYFDGNLTYPVCSQETYGLRLNGGNVSVIWFDTDRKDVVVSVKAEEPIECEKLKMLSQFATMTDDEYRSFFKQNRSKKVLVPLFDDFKGNSYKRKEFLALARVNIIRTILRLFNK